MLDETSIIPLYYQLREVLQEKIKDGTWETGFKIPSERELMELYQVSRATVRKALDELIADGLVYRKQGVGTFVAESKLIQSLIAELSFNQQAIRQGFTPSSKVIQAVEETISAKRMKQFFQLEQKTEIYKIIRIRSINDQPLILETLYIPALYAPNILRENLQKIAVFEYLEKECNLHFTHSTLDIEPIIINEFESQYLDVNIGQPALSLERGIYADDKAIIIQKRIMRGDRGKFTLTLSENLNHAGNYLAELEMKE